VGGTTRFLARSLRAELGATLSLPSRFRPTSSSIPTIKIINNINFISKSSTTLTLFIQFKIITNNHHR
jgi:hypothetical protein